VKGAGHSVPVLLLSQLERGLANPSFRMAQTIARALDLPLGMLFHAHSTIVLN
jgi:transcriptional regulator with XRE-family HTH domain